MTNHKKGNTAVDLTSTRLPKAELTLVILDNVQSLVELTPRRTEQWDRFQMKPSWLRLAAVQHSKGCKLSPGRRSRQKETFGI